MARPGRSRGLAGTANRFRATSGESVFPSRIQREEVNHLLTHYGPNPTGGSTGYPTPQQEQDALELGERVVLELEAERDRQAGWPP